MNIFLAHHDPERRAAHRREKKQRLAEIEVQRLKLSELEAIERTLKRDSETAADRHSEEAGKIQAELDRLDADHVAALMNGEETSAISLQRRGEILQELSKLNTALELQCEANRRAAIPITKQINELRLQVGKAQAVQNDLIGLASPNIRRERKLIELQLMGCAQVSAEIGRLKSIAEHNIHIVEVLNNDLGKAVIYHEQVADCEWMLRKNSDLSSSLIVRDRELHQLALTE